jgi:serine/threonine protein kinase
MSDRLTLIEQMLEGLAFIHSEGCMHRDIRPENVLVSSSPLQAVIIDFGCATFDKTSKDHMKGTIRYLAPEVIALKHGAASNDSKYNMSVDVWSLGLTAHELLSGSRTPRFSEITRKIYDTDLLSALRVNLRPNGEAHPKWAVSLLEEALRWDASARIKSTDAHHRWLQQIQYTLPATPDPRKRLRMSEA